MKTRLIFFGLLALLFSCLVGAFLGAAPARANGATFTVDRTDDTASATACTAAANDCSLRGAIIAANASAGDDLILLPSGVYTLTIANPGGVPDDAALVGDLDITSTLTISGTGNPIVDGNALDRVFEILGPVTATISGLTIQNGYPGDILINSGSALILNNSLARDNAGPFGAYGIANSGALTLDSSTISGHSGSGIINNAILTLSNSTVSGNNAGQGGGIANVGAATLYTSTISANRASYGGGIYNWGTLLLINSTVSTNTSSSEGGGISNLGKLTLDSSVVISNSTSAYGGGIANSGILTVTSSTVLSNTAQDDGGGIYNYSYGIVTLGDSTIFSNTTGSSGYFPQGGGIYNGGVFTASNSTISSNWAASDGGGISNWGTMTITHSVVISNSTPNYGGGIANTSVLSLAESAVSHNVAIAGGGIYNTATQPGSYPFGGILTISHSTISYNAANSGGGIHDRFFGVLTLTDSAVISNTAMEAGGMVANGVLTTTLANATFSGNSASGNGGGLVVIYNSSPVNLNNLTIANNSAAAGGGIFKDGSVVALQNTLLAGNRDTLGASFPDCSGTLTSQGYNLVGDTNGCALAGVTTGNKLGLDPGLGPLQDNGGPTLTHALLSGSPAIDAGNPATPGSGGNACEATDQRGTVRPLGARCDMGAYEALIQIYLPLIMK